MGLAKEQQPANKKQSMEKAKPTTATTTHPNTHINTKNNRTLLSLFAPLSFSACLRFFKQQTTGKRTRTMFSFHKTLLILAAMMMMVSETSARIVSSSSAIGKQQAELITTRKLAANTCELNCGTCTNDNVEVTFLGFVDLTIIGMVWQGIKMCLPLNLAQIAANINLGTCCKDNIPVVQAVLN